MIIEKTDNVETIFKSTELGLVQDDLVFSMMMDGIYTKKLSSVIREISTNAHDSMLASGNTEGFEIFIQQEDTMSYSISIKDKGLGLSKEEVENYLCKLNASSKRDSNDFIGCFGIGSKSVLALTDSYIYTCTKDSKTTLLKIQRQGKNSPTFEILEYSTGESNGVECIFSIKGYSLEDILITIYSELILFKIKPTITISLDTESEEYSIQTLENFFPKVLDKGLFYAVEITESTLRNRQVVNTKQIACGIIGYPYTETNSFQSANSVIRNELTCDTSLKNYYIIPKLEVGSVDINVSRETLADTPKTREAVDRLYNNLLEVQPFSTYKSLREHRQVNRHDFLSLIPILRDNLNHFNKENIELLASIFNDVNYGYHMIKKLDKIILNHQNNAANNFYFSSYMPSSFIIAYLLKFNNYLEDFYNLKFYRVYSDLGASSYCNTYSSRHSLSKPLVYKDSNKFVNSLTYMSSLDNDVIVIRWTPSYRTEGLACIANIKESGIFEVYELEEIKDLYPDSYKDLKTSNKPKRPSTPRTRTEDTPTGISLTGDGFKSGVKHETLTYYDMFSRETSTFSNEFTSLQIKEHLKPKSLFVLYEEYLPKGSQPLVLEGEGLSRPYLKHTTILPLAEQSDPEEVLKIISSGLSSYQWIILKPPSLDLITEDIIKSCNITKILNELFVSPTLEDKLKVISYFSLGQLSKLLQPENGSWYRASITEEFVRNFFNEIPILQTLYNKIYGIIKSYIETYTKLLEPDFAESKQSFIDEHF